MPHLLLKGAARLSGCLSLLSSRGPHQLPIQSQRPRGGCRTLAAAPGLWGPLPSRRRGPAPSQRGCPAPPPPEPSDPQGRECLRLLQQLHRSSQQLWEVTEESLHSLRRRLCHQDSVGLESLLLLCGADRVLRVHVEYGGEEGGGSSWA